MRQPRSRADTHAGPRPRRCLRCSRLFRSEGIHQRICRTCKRTRSPDDSESEARLDSEASRARHERGLRKLMGLPLRQRGIARFFLGFALRFDRCQWIEGEPTADDSCKCGQLARHGSAYCEAHERRTLLRPRPILPRVEDREVA